MEDNLNRFLKAQERDYATALSEIKSGRKRSHWMWYIFPQLAGLGLSETSKFYAIRDKNEAIAFLNHPLLGARLIEITTALLSLQQTNPTSIFGQPDDMKLRSCMTLFAAIDTAPHPVFQRVLDKYFDGKRDQATLQFLRKG
ncbi:MAG TPA: DUF1810 domain-containing protein [Agriterribacter sp.]|nr:DUF1810 domain-containing protein [Chitinophagaceae bacterium]HRP32567.1 DUF1810 domain-containing protein [Agriterribacter sp.]